MRKRIDIYKASIFSVVINAVQIVGMIGIAMLALFTDLEMRSELFVEFIVVLAAAVVIWGAIVDIQQALSARRVSEQSTMLEEAYGQLESLNITLRAQRHDFLNHLQVVSSLIEMGEHTEASDYIERVYGDIRSVSTALRTANPAVNALLKIKMGEAQNRGVGMDVRVHSKWERLPVPGWEMCRVLGNLIDNALDALDGTPDPRISVSIDEDDAQYRFSVENSGPNIPETTRDKLFLPGYTTKGVDRGMGLPIVRRILREYSGDITVTSDSGWTAFTGWIPRGADVAGGK